MAQSGSEEDSAVKNAYIENYKVDGQYFYDDDLMLGEFVSRERMDTILNMDLEYSDIVVASYPKTDYGPWCIPVHIIDVIQFLLDLRVYFPSDKMADSSYIETFRIPGQYWYDDQGLMLGDYAPRHIVDQVRELDLVETDMPVCSYPKTGTTLLQEIIWLLRFNCDQEKAEAINFDRVPFVDDSYFDGLNKFYQLEHPRHFKTHLPYRYLPKQVFEKGLKILYVYRNPKDTLVSYYHFYKMIIGLGFFTGSWDDFFEMFHRVNKGVLYYGSMLKHYKEFWEHRNDPNVFVTSYETLLRHPYTEIKKIADFAELDYDDSLIDKVVKATTFSAMKKNPATNFQAISEVCKFEVSPFMRKGKIGDWKNFFTPEQSEKLDAMVEEELGGTGMEFIYE